MKTNQPAVHILQVTSVVLWVIALLLPAYTISGSPETTLVPGWFCLLMGWTYAFSLTGLAWLANIPFFMAAVRVYRQKEIKKAAILAAAASMMSFFALLYSSYPANEGITHYYRATPSIGCYTWVGAIIITFAAALLALHKK
jgi:hypothetical protein